MWTIFWGGNRAFFARRNFVVSRNRENANNSATILRWRTFWRCAWPPCSRWPWCRSTRRWRHSPLIRRRWAGTSFWDAISCWRAFSSRGGTSRCASSIRSSGSGSSDAVSFSDHSIFLGHCFEQRHRDRCSSTAAYPGNGTTSPTNQPRKDPSHFVLTAHPALQRLKFLPLFLFFGGHFCPPGSGSQCGSGSSPPKSFADPDTGQDPKHCLEGQGIFSSMTCRY